jgi:hypothetical protein
MAMVARATAPAFKTRNPYHGWEVDSFETRKGSSMAAVAKKKTLNSITDSWESTSPTKGKNTADHGCWLDEKTSKEFALVEDKTLPKAANILIPVGLAGGTD